MIEFDSRKQSRNTPRAEPVVWTLKSLNIGKKKRLQYDKRSPTGL